MNEIGGYMELELQQASELYPKALRLNTARSCLRYLIRVFQIKELSMPAYTCPVVWESAREEGCSISLYEINEEFLPKTMINPNHFLLYTNYFGICESQVKKVASLYPKVIIDNSQAFYSDTIDVYSFNSARKFFGVSDGAYLFTDKFLDEALPQDSSLSRMGHLLGRIESGANSVYHQFCQNDESLRNQPIKTMSPLTKRLLCSIDYDQAARRRRENFFYLHRHLKAHNKINISVEEAEVPMIYPLLLPGKENLRDECLENRIYLATYWHGQQDCGFGTILEKDLFPLPIDQRYGISEMNQLLNTLNIR